MKKLKPKEPTLLSVIMTGCSGVSLGVLLGIWLLITEPVNAVSKLPDADAPRKLGDYGTDFKAGRKAAAETTNARSAVSRIQRRTPGPVSFSEEEINYFIGSLEPEKEGADDAEESSTSLENFNVRIDGDVMHASVKVVMNPTGDRFEMLVQARLHFENSEAGPELVIDSMRVNSLPVPAVGGMISSMISSKLASTEWPEDFVEMWQNIKSIELESDKMIVEVGLRRAS
ncbi:hypothetical protein [Pelagicoccus sp. SDUM812003]|uniref:hypothetical protein n=1 Tax=Pelagicoccus sp. SDUM812003 TaxID=3041267 RepID=UPI00280CF1F4|nr:hypothetical protein [Pelagicoccus sp. SDUM812003]MDQ8202139.1 hypothetical protein [Pelagicoccus sp. SDUM812003]